MATAAQVQAPPLKAYPVIPILARDSMAASKPYVASEKMNEALGFPGKLVENWQAKAIDKMGELLGKYRALPVFLDSCVHCGACTDKCHYFLGTGDPKNMPVARQDLFRKVYRRYFTWSGKLFPKLVGAEDLTESVLDDWYRYFNQCSECRRCSVYCPYGIDTAEITMAAKEVMDSIGVGQKYSNEIIGKVHKIGNNLGLPGPALRNTLETLEEEVKEETGLDGGVDAHICTFDQIKNSGYYLGGIQHIFVDYVFKVGSKKVRLNDEAQDYVWMPAKQALRDLDIEPNARHTVELYNKG